MTRTATHNGQIPTDPQTTLILILAITWSATQLTTDQAAALASIGVLAELALTVLQLIRGGR